MHMLNLSYLVLLQSMTTICVYFNNGDIVCQTKPESQLRVQ